MSAEKVKVKTSHGDVEITQDEYKVLEAWCAIFNYMDRVERDDNDKNAVVTCSEEDK